jgi:hypothetical protein
LDERRDSILSETLEYRHLICPQAPLAEVEAALAAASFTPQGRALLEARWAALRPYLSGTESIRRRLKPGVLLILDIRGDWITERCAEPRCAREIVSR